jgi:hypothetical protein
LSVTFQSITPATPPDGTIVETTDTPLTGKRQVVSGADYDYQPISTSSQYNLTVSAATFLTVPATARQCIVYVETANVRWTIDGTTPTSSVGHLLVSGQDVKFSGSAIMSNLQFFGVASTATLTVSYTK